MAGENNYVVGRGKLYMDRWDDAGVPSGTFLYFGNTPALSLTQSATTLDHYSSDEGVKVKDDSVDLQSDLGGAFTCDNINANNLAMFFLGTAEVDAIATGAATKATGTATFSGVGTADDTLTIHGQAITLKASGAAGFQANIGASATETAQNVKTLINNNPHAFGVTADGAAAVLTLTAVQAGLAGNSITLAKSSTAIAVSAATLTGATDGGAETLSNVVKGGYYPLGVTADLPAGVRDISSFVISGVTADGNYEIDNDLGLLHVLADATDIDDGDDLDVTYDVGGSTRTLIIGSNNTIYGSLRFYSKNPKGRQKDYFWPYVKLTPDGDLNLKGDDWQTVGFKFDVLQTGSDATGRVIIDDRG